MEPALDVPAALARWRSHGDEAAAAALIVHFHPLVSRVVRSHLPRREAEEDLVQEIFMKAFNRLHQFKNDAPFEHWLARVARTTCWDKLRAQRRRPEWRWADLSEGEQAAWVDGASDGRPNAAASLGARDLVDRLLASIPLELRKLVVMADVEERSAPEIAALTGQTVATVKMRLFRARGKLREALVRLEKNTPNLKGKRE